MSGRWKRKHDHDGHDHEDGEECFECKHGAEAMRRWEEDCMAKHGWYAHYVMPSTGGAPGCPYDCNLHTHGIPVTFPGAMDAQLCLPPSVKPDVAHGFFVSYVDLLKEGHRFKHGDASARIIRGLMVCFARATEQDRDVLRIILPDRHGHFLKGAIGGGLDEQWMGADEVTEFSTMPTGPGTRKPRVR